MITSYSSAAAFIARSGGSRRASSVHRSFHGATRSFVTSITHTAEQQHTSSSDHCYNHNTATTRSLSTDEASSATSLCPLVISGPSGVGKGTIIERFMQDHADHFGFSVSHTTRKPRPGEKDGVHYNFSDVETMKQEIDAGKFIEYAEVHGNYYGTSFEAVDAVRQDGKVCLLDIDVQGVQNLKKTGFEANYVFIAPPSLATLRSRLEGRGTETPESLERRTLNASKELNYGLKEGSFDVVIVNDDLDSACRKFTEALDSFYQF